MRRSINKVAVLGSGVMGSRIACHFANIGVEVLLLDIAPPPPKGGNTGDVSSKTPLLGGRGARNKIVNDALAFALKSNPSPIYKKSFANRITTGNFEDDMKNIASCDWIIEVVVERLDIKKIIFEQVEKFRKPGTLISSNTSGIPIHLMLDGRSEDFQKHFCGTHFFNPPRYLKLLEIIPTPKTDKAVIDFLMHYGDLYLGKTTVLCKDTPAFIANRVGVFGIMSLFHLVEKMGLTVEEVDKLTGPVLGRPKSATFRTCDVVGLDTLVHVANGLAQNLPNDEAKEFFRLPNYVAKMNESKWFGDKTGQGFYKKVKLPPPVGEGPGARSEIQALDLKTLAYKPSQKVKFATLEQTKPIENLKDRLKVLISGKDKAGDFYRASFFGLFQYVSNRIPEISDELYKIDDAMKAGFGWELGPFEYWDTLGVEETVKAMEAAGTKPAKWVYDMLASGRKSFYTIENEKRTHYSPLLSPSRIASAKPASAERGSALAESFSEAQRRTKQGRRGADPKDSYGGGEASEYIMLDIIRPTKTVWKNSGATVTDIGDGIINLEWNTKMNSIGGEVIEGINKAIEIAEKDFRGLVISNEGANFSAGANVGMIFMFAVEQEWDELNFAIKAFQNTMMHIRYSEIPVVVAPHNLALGGACEMSMHSDKVVAHAETYMGLVEFGVGLIPGGGGTKEFALRLSDELQEGDIELNNFRDRFLAIGQAKVSTSAYEAFDLGYLRKGKDIIVVSRARLLAEAKAECMEIAREGYSKPTPRKDIRVLGKQALGLAYLGANSMLSGNYISEHDVKISQKLAHVLCGGDLSAPTLVSEQYLLDLEREAFLSLCGEKKTLERIQSILKGGKVLRN